ncbi:hypothetical protein FG147_08510, partial [Thauera sp. UPWRP]
MNEISFQDKPSRDEDFLVEATLIANNSEICTVPCRIYLPERVHEKPYVVLKPKQEAAKQIIGAWKASLKATVYGFDNEAEVTIDAPEVYLSGGSTRYWGNGISDATKLGEPQDLHVVRHLRNRSSVSKTQLVFWISQNRLLEPCMASTSSYTGKIEYERVNVFECYSGGRLKLAFDRHFRTKTESNGDLRQWSFLVAITEVEVAANSADLIKSQILPDIDDLLLIASFAARTRTACLGWTACDDKSLATFYRGNYAFPELNEATDRDNSTIERVDFMEFIETAS